MAMEPTVCWDCRDAQLRKNSSCLYDVFGDCPADSPAWLKSAMKKARKSSLT